MRCCVSFCKNTEKSVSKSDRITFHKFPTEQHLHTAWLQALGKQDCHLPDSAVVCSQHFLSDDIFETRNGSRQISTGAVPSTVHVCMICLDPDSKQLLISKYKLEAAYEILTGYSLCDVRNLKQTLCVECAQRLINFSKFRDKSLRAHSLMMDLVTKHDFITIQHIKSINRLEHKLESNTVTTVLDTNHCDLYICEKPDEDKETELDKPEQRVADIVTDKSDESSMLIDDYIEPELEMIMIKNETNIDNVNDDFVESNKEYISDVSILETKPLNMMKSTISEEKETELQESIKVEVMFECEACFETFSDENVYREHIMTHVKQEDGCDFDVNEIPLDNHLLTAYKAEPRSRSNSCSSSSITDKMKEDDYRRGKKTRLRLSAKRKKCNLLRKSKRSKINSHLIQTSSENPPSDDSDTLIIPTLTRYETNDKKLVHQIDETNKIDKSRQVFEQDKVNSKSTNEESIVVSRKKETQKGSLVNHTSIHSNEKPFSCNLCEYKCATNSILKRHMRIHTGEKPFSCTVCESKFAHSTSLINHMTVHTGAKPFSCELCEYKSARKSDLVSHMCIHTGVKPFSCKLCDSTFTKKGLLVIHMRTHTGEKPFGCKLCEYKCIRRGDLANHMRTHTGEKPHSCKFCGYRCSIKASLAIHMRTHTGVKPFSCDLCKYQFARKNTLVTHMRIHTGEKPFSCKLCEYKCRRSGDLATHMRIHTGEKPHPCKLCDYKAARSGDLVSHMKTHTGEKRFFCKLCNFKCSDSGNLVVHTRTHTGEKPFACKLCEYKCARSYSLVIHMRSHTGEKPYSCKLCGHKYTVRHHLVKHMKTHTETKSLSK